MRSAGRALPPQRLSAVSTAVDALLRDMSLKNRVHPSWQMYARRPTGFQRAACFAGEIRVLNQSGRQDRCGSKRDKKSAQVLHRVRNPFIIAKKWDYGNGRFPPPTCPELVGAREAQKVDIFCVTPTKGVISGRSRGSDIYREFEDERLPF